MAVRLNTWAILLLSSGVLEAWFLFTIFKPGTFFKAYFAWRRLDYDDVHDRDTLPSILHRRREAFACASAEVALWYGVALHRLGIDILDFLKIS